MTTMLLCMFVGAFCSRFADFLLLFSVAGVVCYKNEFSFDDELPTPLDFLSSEICWKKKSYMWDGCAIICSKQTNNHTLFFASFAHKKICQEMRRKSTLHMNIYLLDASPHNAHRQFFARLRYEPVIVVG